VNLDFTTLGQVEKDGVAYNAQRADVTDNSKFWAAWNYAKKVRAEAELLNAELLPDLSSTVRLTREIINGKLRWYATRLAPLDSSLPAGQFRQSFTLRDTRGLLEYQKSIVTYLCNSIVNHGSACDGSDTGIGKTYHALGVCRNLIFRPGIICRKAGVAGWYRACRLMGVVPLFVCNWEQAKGRDFPYCIRTRSIDESYHYQWRVPDDTLLIYDECHMAAVVGTLNNRLWLSSKGISSLSLSATFTDRPTRMLSLLWLLGAIKSREEFHGWLSNRGHFVNRYDEMEAVDASADMQEINKLLYPRYGYRISYTDPAVKSYFPEAVYQTEVVSLSDQETARQNALYGETIKKVEHYRTLGQQAEAMVADLRYRQATELLKASAVAELATDFMEQGASVCIFVNFRETLAWFAKHFKTNSLIFGDQDRYKLPRESVIAAFQANKVRLLVAMANAGGQSIDLHDTVGGHPRISLICPTYDPIVLKQVLGRTYRSGAKTVPVMKLVYAAGTIEEKVSEIVNSKLDSISALNEGDLMEPDLFNMGVNRNDT